MRKNGLRTFAVHALEGGNLRSAVGRPFAASVMALENVDAETAARHYLEQALASAQVPEAAAPPVNGSRCEFKSLGGETVPLTRTHYVKFRQHCRRVPIYGSLVTVELDEKKELLSISSALGEPHNVDPVAKVSPAEALAAVAARAGRTRMPAAAVPRLHYYFDQGEDRWRLVYIVENVLKSEAAAAPGRNGGGGADNGRPSLPELVDFVVDAHGGEIVAELPRTQTAAAAAPVPEPAADIEEAEDALRNLRRIRIAAEADRRVLRDEQDNIHTHDFLFQDAFWKQDLLPGGYVTLPASASPWDPGAVSAHANAMDVAAFLRDVLMRHGLDNRGGPFISTINCVYQGNGGGSQEWRNAAWIGTQMIYGQKKVEGSLRSYAVARDIVAHEIIHGLTDYTARLEYAGMSGALNESYSDIFGIIISNHGLPLAQWDWRLGEDLDGTGVPIRDLSDPARHDQPAHMRDYKNLPVDRWNDMGGVHVNSGIHNKAAYNLLTSRNPDGTGVVTADEAAALFYLALTQHLSRTSGFADSRRAVLTVARTLFRNDGALDAKLFAINKAFAEVGIE